MDVVIYQGQFAPSEKAEVTIIIDVIRAFTVAHYAFLRGAQKIYLAATVEEAWNIKKANPEYLLAGEIGGLAIEGFDLDNSPYHLDQQEIKGKSLIQKTTNGVAAALNHLHSDHLFVTGFSNAHTTANYIKEKMLQMKVNRIHIVASHPTGDDDLACAEYIKGIIEHSSPIHSRQVIDRVLDSHVAKKFFDPQQPNFIEQDLNYCIKEIHTNFVMKVHTHNQIPVIERVQI